MELSKIANPIMHGAEDIRKLNKVPELRFFSNGLLTSHRNFDKFYARLRSKKKSAIVSGLNPSGRFHLGHICILDTNLFFQKRHNLEIFTPISDDESYVAGKIPDQKTGLANSLEIAREYLAYGFDPRKTHIIIDQIYTNIYNLAIKLSRSINITEIRSIFDYKNSDSVGLNFYTSVQAAHVLFPETKGMRNVLVPIGPDEDTHLRICRGIAGDYGYEKPAVLHCRILPGIDGRKMSKSKGNAIFLFDNNDNIKNKIGTIKTDRKRPNGDVAFTYIRYLLGNGEELCADYKAGKITENEMKSIFYDYVTALSERIKEHYNRISEKDMERAILSNESTDIKKIVEDSGILSREW